MFDMSRPNKITATLQLELSSNEGFAANTKRGTGHVFDQTALDRFLVANQLSHVVRAHELHQNGFMVTLQSTDVKDTVSYLMVFLFNLLINPSYLVNIFSFYYFLLLSSFSSQTCYCHTSLKLSIVSLVVQ